jgi:hypothetical protein
MDIVWYLLIFLGPILPAYFVFKQIGPSNIRANVHGGISGLQVKAGGAFAAYVIICAIALTVFLQVRKETGASENVNAEMMIRVSSADSTEVTNYLSNAGSRVELILDDGQTVPLSIKGFSADASLGLLRTTFQIAKASLGRTYDVRVEAPEQKLILKLRSIRLRPSTEIEVELQAAIPQWVAVLDATKVLYPETPGEQVWTRLVLLQSRDGRALDTVIFAPFDNFGLVKRFDMLARRLSKTEYEAILSKWERKEIEEKDSIELSAQFDETCDSVSSHGEEIGKVDRILKQDNVSWDEQVQGQGVYVIANGTTPHIGPLEVPIRGSTTLAILIRQDAFPGPHPDMAGIGEDWLGHRFSWPTKRSLAIIDSGEHRSIDKSTIRFSYRKPFGVIDIEMMHPLRKVGARNIFVDLLESERDDYDKLIWAWQH